jgi:hypothetical protein
MPSGGALSNPNDKALVTALEDKMIEAYGTALVGVKCKAAGGEAVDLGDKMLRPQHVDALFAAPAAVERSKRLPSCSWGTTIFFFGFKYRINSTRNAEPTA